MSTSAALVGFTTDSLQQHEGVAMFDMSHGEALPEAPVVALLVDSAGVDAEATMRRRVDINKAIGRGATVLVQHVQLRQMAQGFGDCCAERNYERMRNKSQVSS